MSGNQGGIKMSLRCKLFGHKWTILYDGKTFKPVAVECLKCRQKNKPMLLYYKDCYKKVKLQFTEK